MEYITESQFLLSILVLAVGWLLKLGSTKLIKQKAIKKDIDKRYLINSSRNAINLVLVILLFVIWSDDLQRFALSIAAFVVAIVLATKEVIQCFIGFIYLSSTNPFRVGDWIQVGDFTGEVNSTDWAKVTLLEVDLADYDYTGKTLFIPNSQLMTQPVKNLNFMRRYVNHSFTFVKENPGFNPFRVKNYLLDRARLYCSEFIDVAERYNTLIENRLEVQISGPSPSLKISTTELGKIKLSFNIFCPTKQAKQIEQKLFGDFLECWLEQEKQTTLLSTQVATETPDGQSKAAS